MAEFIQVMKDWRRMCKAYTTDDESCCYGCPVVDFHEHGCGAIFEMGDNTDWERYEGAIREWAAEHAEPVFPTWWEWLSDNGFVQKAIAPDLAFELTETGLVEPIPADIARKLGIEPKEDE